MTAVHSRQLSSGTLSSLQLELQMKTMHYRLSAGTAGRSELEQTCMPPTREENRKQIERLRTRAHTGARLANRAFIWSLRRHFSAASSKGAGRAGTEGAILGAPAPRSAPGGRCDATPATGGKSCPHRVAAQISSLRIFWRSSPMSWCMKIMLCCEARVMKSSSCCLNRWCR